MINPRCPSAKGTAIGTVLTNALSNVRVSERHRATRVASRPWRRAFGLRRIRAGRPIIVEKWPTVRTNG
jgi:hypothetical protein